MDLLEAVESGDEAGVKRCLDDGADALFADDEGFTCLHMAAQEGYDAIAMMLLRKGALVDATDDSGVTPLMLAAEAGHDVCVAILVKEKANVLLSDKLGKTALFRCRRGGLRGVSKGLAGRVCGRLRVSNRGKDTCEPRRSEGQRVCQAHRARAFPRGSR